METVETIFTLAELVTALSDLFDSDGDGQLIPKEVTDVLTTLDNGEIGDNDLEIILDDIKNSLMYNEDYTALYELSSRLELIDARLDTEFEVLNYGIGVIGSVLLAYVSVKFIKWILRPFTT